MDDKNHELGWFGEINHYDGNGNLTGTSEPSIFGGYDHFDQNHNYVGRSDMELDGSFTNYDAAGNMTGSTEVTWAGDVIHHNADEINTRPNSIGTGESRSEYNVEPFNVFQKIGCLLFILFLSVPAAFIGYLLWKLFV